MVPANSLPPCCIWGVHWGADSHPVSHRGLWFSILLLSEVSGLMPLLGLRIGSSVQWQRPFPMGHLASTVIEELSITQLCTTPILGVATQWASNTPTCLRGYCPHLCVSSLRDSGSLWLYHGMYYAQTHSLQPNKLQLEQKLTFIPIDIPRDKFRLKTFIMKTIS
jgi:hypothetical protein